MKFAVTRSAVNLLTSTSNKRSCFQSYVPKKRTKRATSLFNADASLMEEGQKMALDEIKGNENIESIKGN